MNWACLWWRNIEKQKNRNIFCYQTTNFLKIWSSFLVTRKYKEKIKVQARRNCCRVAAPYPPSRLLLSCIFHELKKIVLKWKNDIKLKTSWNSSKVTDISNIIIDLDTRDGILSVINCDEIFTFLAVHAL